MNKAALVAYRAASELAGKAAFFGVTVIAARTLTRDGFGVFSLGTTAGWIAAVASDFGVQMHLARAVAQHRERAAGTLRAWLRFRAWTSVALLGVAGAFAAAAGVSRETAIAVLLFTLVYLVSGLVEFINYFYRGLGR